MTAYPMPDASRVHATLGVLFEGLGVRAASRRRGPPAQGSWIGLYAADSGAPVAACLADPAFAAHASAALSMLPPALARAAADTGELTDLMVGNLREVLHICARLLACEESPHLRLAELYRAGALPAAVSALLGGSARRIDFELTVPKYGPGTLAVVST